VSARRAWIASSTTMLLFAGTSAHAEDCTARNAERATVPRIAARQQEYNGRCVIVDGVMHRLSLFESVDGVYLEPPDGLDPSSSGFRLGLDNLDRHFTEAYEHVTIVGRVQDCEEIRAMADASLAEGEFGWVSGYCHSHNGAYLWVKQLRHRRGVPFRRQMGSYERTDYGDIKPAPADWPHTAFIEAQAATFLAALRAKDRAELARLHFRNAGLEWDEDEKATLRFLLDDRRSPFASLRDSATAPQQLILVERSRLPDYEDGEYFDKDDYAAIVRFCREADCTGRWPIATFDAENLRTRPYACIIIQPWLIGPGEGDVPNFSTEIGKYGLAEPAR
jgi:hypothetical protein